MISAVVFDVFGTVVRVGQRTNPYLQLFREGRRQGLAVTRDATLFAMTANLSFDDTAASLGISLSPSKRNELREALEREVSSIVRYPDTAEAIARLQDAGVVLGFCSNLAQAYGDAVRKLFPQIQCQAFSYELGVMKPNPLIYHSICNLMGVEPGHCFSQDTGRVMMIGDSLKCDRDGPRLIGMMGLHLDRSGRGPINDLLSFAKLVEVHNANLV